jgi:hypothetical protein
MPNQTMKKIRKVISDTELVNVLENKVLSVILRLDTEVEVEKAWSMAQDIVASDRSRESIQNILKEWIWNYHKMTIPVEAILVPRSKYSDFYNKRILHPSNIKTNANQNDSKESI